MLDRVALNVASPLLSGVIAAAALAFGPLPIGVICAVLTATIIVVLWTPVRGRLGISPMAMPEKRVGYIGRHGSYGNLRNARLGKGLSVGIDNAGDVDASEARIGADDDDEPDADEKRGR